WRAISSLASGCVDGPLFQGRTLDLEPRGRDTLRLHLPFDPEQNLLEGRLPEPRNLVEDGVIELGEDRLQQAFKRAQVHDPAVAIGPFGRHARGHDKGMAVHLAVVRGALRRVDIVARLETG